MSFKPALSMLPHSLDYQEYTRLNPEDVETRRGLVPKRRPIAKKTKADWKRESRDRSRASGIAERSDALEDVGL